MKKLKHMEHIEDLVIDEGYDGAIKALRRLSSIVLKDLVLKIKIQEKIDGAPSIVAGINPENGKFFAGTKSVFNKTPKLNYTFADIDRNHGHSPELCGRLRDCLAWLPDVITSGICQGDLLYVKSSADWKVAPWIAFKPNTIEYRLKKSDWDTFNKSQLGIVWHTMYKGPSIEELEAKFCCQPQLRESDSVWSFDPTISIDSYEFTELEQVMFMRGVEHIKNWEVHDHTLSDNVFKYVKQFINARCKEGKSFMNEYESLVELVSFIRLKYNKYTEKLITDKAKARKQTECEALVGSIIGNVDNTEYLMWMFEIHSQIQELKMIVLRKFDEMDFRMQSFIDDKETGPEGFVVSDKFNNVYKIVDRMGFSRVNFNMMKDWK